MSFPPSMWTLTPFPYKSMEVKREARAAWCSPWQETWSSFLLSLEGRSEPERSSPTHWSSLRSDHLQPPPEHHTHFQINTEILSALGLFIHVIHTHTHSYFTSDVLLTLCYVIIWYSEHWPSAGDHECCSWNRNLKECPRLQSTCQSTTSAQRKKKGGRGEI